MSQGSPLTLFSFQSGVELILRIIEPLASRCAKFRFKALDPINTKSRIEFIAEQEHVNMEDGVSTPLPITMEAYNDG